VSDDRRRQRILGQARADLTELPTMIDPLTDHSPTPLGCDLRRIEYDGSQYCGTHFGFAHRGGDPWCDRSPKATETGGVNGLHVPHVNDECAVCAEIAKGDDDA
jgi:hypothetical protein